VVVIVVIWAIKSDNSSIMSNLSECKMIEDYNGKNELSSVLNH